MKQYFPISAYDPVNDELVTVMSNELLSIVDRGEREMPLVYFAPGADFKRSPRQVTSRVGYRELLQMLEQHPWPKGLKIVAQPGRSPWQ